MTDRVGQQFGNYKLIRFLDSGSFAEVYLGKHVYLENPVAVKVLRMQLPNSGGKSFLIEARTVANLTHSHIVKVWDYGIYEEHVPYLVMNYASRGTLRQRHPDHTVLSPSIVVSYVKQIASALQYAHDRKLIHRDVKPDNILLGPEDELWLSDFGLATIAHSSMSQITEDMAAGTPDYMAPEQFVGKTRTASDQYALAVMAYEWLCGERPFQDSYSYTELRNQHMYGSVPSLCEKEPTISPAIEEVVLTALAKDPYQRFASVQAFADALEQAYLLAGSSSDLLAPSSQKEFPPMGSQPVPIPDAVDTESPTLLSPMGSFPSEQDDIPLAPDKLSSAAEDKQAPGFSKAPVLPDAIVKEPEIPIPSDRGISRRRVLMWLGGAIVLASTAAVIALELASSPKSSKAKPTSTPTPVPIGTRIFTYQGQKSGVKAAAWSPDGKSIASGGIDHTVHIWNAFSGEDVLNPPYSGHTAGLNAVAWSPHGEFIASGGEDQTVHVWNAATGNDLLFSPYMQHQATVRAVAWSPTQPLIASASFDGTVQVWSSTDGKQVHSFSPPSPPRPLGERALAWSHDGKHIVSGGDNNTVYVWDTTTGHMPYSFPGHTNSIQAVAWSPDRQHIASGSFDHTVKIWKIGTREPIFTYRHHTNQVWSVAWSLDGKYIASASVDGTVQIWKPL